MVASPAEQSVFAVLRLGERLLAVSDRGEEEADDDNCRLLFAVARDCAFKVIAEARKAILIQEKTRRAGE